MGKQSSKIKDILYVTGQDLDPPEAKVQKKYNPTKQVQFDYGGFKPKKYYKADATDQQIQEHQRKLKKKQDILKLFKYYKEFDRINFNQMKLTAATFQIHLEESLKFGIITAFIIARITQIQMMSEYYTAGGTLRLVVPFFLMIAPALVYGTLTSAEYHIINHEYFRQTDQQIALFQELHYQLDYYKDVDDIKYNFRYPKVRQFYKTKREVLDKGLKAKKGQFLEYFQYYNKLKLDRYEEFTKKRQQTRKQKGGSLSAQEKEYILSELQNNKTIL